MAKIDPYEATFPVGSKVRIADKNFLENFQSTWKYHHSLQPEQLAHADAVGKVKEVSFYHGGDQLYILENLPGIWHEQCLRAAL
ncbi:MAG: hypothetical protein V4587_02620 [Acidobacteriota bacterium]